MIIRIFLLAMSLVWAGTAFAAGGSSTVGPSHPSAKYCIQEDGDLVGFKIPHKGEFSVCVLRDRSMVSSMTLWWHKMEVTPALSQFLLADASGYEHLSEEVWADQYCKDVGGVVEVAIERLRPSVTYSFCIFENRYAIETWTLFRGKSFYPILKRYAVGIQP